MKVLVIGGAGYIGLALAKRLTETEHEVVIEDIILGQDVREASGEGYDVVVDLAALRLKQSQANPQVADDVNHKAAVRLAKTSKHFIFASTCSNYGMNPDYVDEDCELIPTSVYAQTKVAAEQELMGRATILRFATAYGLSQKFREDLILHEFVIDALNDGRITLYGADFYRPICHVDDIARAIVMAIEKQPIDVFNIGNTAHNYMKYELAKIVQKSVECDIDIIPANPDPRNYRVSFEKAAKEMHYCTIHDVDEEVKHLVKVLQH